MVATPKENPQATSDRILGCAEELFGTRGYDSVAVSDIADACGVSTSLIYYHYRDKESLLRAIVERANALLSAPAVATLTRDGSARSRIESFVNAWVDVALEHQALVRILMQPFTDPGSPLANELQQTMAAAITSIARVIEEGSASGEFARVDPYLSAECLFALVNTRLVARAIDAPHSQFLGTDPEDIAAFITHLFFEGIRPC